MRVLLALITAGAALLGAASVANAQDCVNGYRMIKDQIPVLCQAGPGSQTGLGPSNLRAAAQEPGFLVAVLDHLAGSDSLLLEFAGNLSLNPEIVAQARGRLAGPPMDEAP